MRQEEVNKIEQKIEDQIGKSDFNILKTQSKKTFRVISESQFKIDPDHLNTLFLSGLTLVSSDKEYYQMEDLLKAMFKIYTDHYLESITIAARKEYEKRKEKDRQTGRRNREN